MIEPARDLVELGVARVVIGDLFAQLSLGVFEIFLLFAELLVPFVEAVLAFF